MPKFQSFEDIESWKKARELTKAIYLVTEKGEFARDFSLRDQIRRAAISIMSNIAEGFERFGDIEFGHFLSIAKGSAGEVKCQLIIAKDIGRLAEEDFNHLYQLADDVGKLIGGLLKYIKGNSKIIKNK